jgi:uncharacterized protein YciI
MNTYVIVLDKVSGHILGKETILRHVEHLRSLHQEGRLVLCGPFSDYPSGMVVIKADDKDQATKIAESDPFVQEGARTFSIRTWLLANTENNFLAD